MLWIDLYNSHIGHVASIHQLWIATEEQCSIAQVTIYNPVNSM